MPGHINETLWQARKGFTSGLLTVLDRDRSAPWKGHVIVQCACGLIKSVYWDAIANKATKSCGCKTQEWKVAGHITHGKTHTRQYQLWIAARQRAKDNHVPFGIEIEDVVIPKTCPVFGTTLLINRPRDGNGKAQDNTPSLDRVIPVLGYIRGNVQVISWRANRLKQAMTPGEAKLLSQYMDKYAPR